MSDVGYRRHWDRCRCPPMYTVYMYVLLFTLSWDFLCTLLSFILNKSFFKNWFRFLKHPRTWPSLRPPRYSGTPIGQLNFAAVYVNKSVLKPYTHVAVVSLFLLVFSSFHSIRLILIFRLYLVPFYRFLFHIYFPPSLLRWHWPKFPGGKRMIF